MVFYEVKIILKPTKRYLAVLTPPRCDKINIERSLRAAMESLGGLILLTSTEMYVIDIAEDVTIIKALTRGPSVDVFLAVIALTNCNGTWLIPLLTSGSIRSLRKNLLTRQGSLNGDEVKPSQTELKL